MATTLRTLLLNIEARSAQFERSMDRVERRSASVDRGMKVLGATLLGVFSARAVLRGAKDLLEVFGKQEEAVIALRASLQVTGKGGGQALGYLTQKAAEFQQITTKGDEAIIQATSSLALLATQLDAAQLAQSQKALIGIADVFLKGDLESAANLLGKTIGSTTNALTRYGIKVDATATQQEKLAQIVDQTNRFFEVSTERATSLNGRIQQMANAWGDLKEAMAGAANQRLGITNLFETMTIGFQNIAEGGTFFTGGGRQMRGLTQLIDAQRTQGGLQATIQDLVERRIQVSQRFGERDISGRLFFRDKERQIEFENLARAIRYAQSALERLGTTAGSLAGGGIQPTIAPIGPVINARNVGGGGFMQQISAAAPNVNPLTLVLRQMGTEGLQNLERQIDTTKVLSWEQQQAAEASAKAAMNVRRMALAGLQAANALMQVARGGGGFFGTLGGLLGTAGAFLTATGVGGLFLGPALAAGGGLISGLASGRGRNDPVPVIIRDYDQQAIDKIRREGPDTVIVVVKQGDEELSRTAYRLQRGARRDAYQRIPGNIIPGTA